MNGIRLSKEVESNTLPYFCTFCMVKYRVGDRYSVVQSFLCYKKSKENIHHFFGTDTRRKGWRSMLSHGEIDAPHLPRPGQGKLTARTPTATGTTRGLPIREFNRAIYKCLTFLLCELITL